MKEAAKPLDVRKEDAIKRAIDAGAISEEDGNEQRDLTVHVRHAPVPHPSSGKEPDRLAQPRKDSVRRRNDRKL